MAGNERRILVNQPRSSYFVGGAEMVSLEHAKYLADKGCEVTFVTVRPDSIHQPYSQQYLNLKSAYLDKISFIELAQQPEATSWYEIDPGENRDRWNVESLYFNRSLFAWLASSEYVYDVMISYYKLDAMVVPRDKVRTSALYLCGTPRTESIFMSSFLAMYDKIVAITEDVKDYWQRYTLQTIDVVATGVDVDRFKPAAKGGESLRILFVGRLIERKGADTLIEACSLLPDELKKNFTVMIVGAGPQLAGLKKLVDSRGLAGIVRFVGKTDEPEKLMSTADICVFPSKRGEGLQGVILESMASGTYVIASDTRANRLLIGDDKGVLIDPGNTRQIADAIIEAVVDSTKRISAADLAVKHVRMNYNWARMADELMERVT